MTGIEPLAWALFGIVLCVIFLLLRWEGRPDNSGVMKVLLFVIFIWTFVLPALWIAERLMR